MGGFPVNPPAGRTRPESRLRSEHIDGHPIPEILLLDRFGRHVALQAAPAQAGCQKSLAVPVDHLAELLFEEMAVNQQGPPGGFAQHEARVAGQENSALARRQVHEIGVFDVAKKDHVVPQDSQPPGETTQHAVGGEAQRLTFDTPGSVC